MKTIVIAGARAKIGKTTLARELNDLLPNSVRIKIGHGNEKPSKDRDYFHLGTPMEQILSHYSEASYLIIESNAALKELDPELVIFLTADDPKPSAEYAKSRAHLIRGERVTNDCINAIAERLKVDQKTVRKMAWLAGAFPEAVSFVILPDLTRNLDTSVTEPIEIRINNTIKLFKPFSDNVFVDYSKNLAILNQVASCGIDKIALNQSIHSAIQNIIDSVDHHHLVAVSVDFVAKDFPRLFHELALIEDTSDETICIRVNEACRLIIIRYPINIMSK